MKVSSPDQVKKITAYLTTSVMKEPNTTIFASWTAIFDAAVGKINTNFWQVKVLRNQENCYHRDLSVENQTTLYNKIMVLTGPRPRMN